MSQQKERESTSSRNRKDARFAAGPLLSRVEMGKRGNGDVLEAGGVELFGDGVDLGVDLAQLIVGRCERGASEDQREELGDGVEIDRLLRVRRSVEWILAS